MKPQTPKDLYKLIFDNTLEGLAYCQMIFDTQGNPVDWVYIQVNKHFEKLTALKGAEGKKVTELIPGIKTSNPELFEIYGRVSFGGKSERFETYVGPLQRWFLISAHRVKREFFVAIFQNITKLKKKEKDLADARSAAANVLEDLSEEKLKVESLAKDLEKFKLAIASTTEQVVITDKAGVVLYANPPTEKLTGYAMAEIVGQKVGKLWGRRMKKDFYDTLWQTVLVDKKTFSGELENTRKNGEEYTADLIVSPMLDQSGEVEFFVVVEHDITREKAIEKAKTEFVSLASHQLRTPLTGIQWMAELFSRKEKLTSTGKKYLHDIIVSAQRLNMLIKLLLNVSRIESGSIGIAPEAVDLAEFMNECLRNTRVICKKKRISLAVANPTGALPAVIDKNALGQILQNILGNAVEYTPPEGKIEVSLSVKEKNALVTVKDTGIGIPKKDQARIFKKFVRAENAATMKPDGSGLGLYIASEAAKLLGGKIWFESKEGIGSMFYASIPIKAKPRAGEKGFEPVLI